MNKLLALLFIFITCSTTASPVLSTCDPVKDVEVDAVACFSMGSTKNDYNGTDGKFTLNTISKLETNFNSIALNDFDPAPWYYIEGFGAGDKAGYITFSDLMDGFFAVTLKAGSGYNAYLFDGGIIGIDKIEYFLNLSLSHASLWTFDPVTTNFGCNEGDCGFTVPLPNTIFLIVPVVLGLLLFKRKPK